MKNLLSIIVILAVFAIGGIFAYQYHKNSYFLEITTRIDDYDKAKYGMLNDLNTLAKNSIEATILMENLCGSGDFYVSGNKRNFLEYEKKWNSIVPQARKANEQFLSLVRSEQSYISGLDASRLSETQKEFLKMAGMSLEQEKRAGESYASSVGPEREALAVALASLYESNCDLNYFLDKSDFRKTENASSVREKLSYLQDLRKYTSESFVFDNEEFIKSKFPSEYGEIQNRKNLYGLTFKYFLAVSEGDTQNAKVLKNEISSLNGNLETKPLYREELKAWAGSIRDGKQEYIKSLDYLEKSGISKSAMGRNRSVAMAIKSAVYLYQDKNGVYPNAKDFQELLKILRPEFLGDFGITEKDFAYSHLRYEATESYRLVYKGEDASEPEMITGMVYGN